MDKHLREHLEQLHREIAIEGAKVVDAADKELLLELLDDLHRVLESAETSSPTDENEPLPERLGHAIEKFEESHPTLTATLARLSEALGRIAV